MVTPKSAAVVDREVFHKRKTPLNVVTMADGVPRHSSRWTARRGGWNSEGSMGSMVESCDRIGASPGGIEEAKALPKS